MIYNQNITLDLNTNTSYIIVGAKQGDSGRTITATILQNGNLFSIPSTATAFYRIHKSSGEGVWAGATLYSSESKVVIPLTSYDLSETGRNFADIMIINNNETIISTVTFIIDVKEVPNMIESANDSDVVEYFHIQKLLEFSNNNGNMIIAIASQI